jgi:hypothetical protein
MAYPRFRKARAHKMLRRSTGTNITLNSTSIAEVAAATNGPGAGGFDLALPAAVGDVLAWGFNGLIGLESVTASIDIYTIVSAARVNPFGSGLSASSASTAGPSAWYCEAGRYAQLAGEALYAVQAGDIVSGVVTCRPYYVQTTASNRTLFTNANNGLQMWLKNLGPVAV